MSRTRSRTIKVLDLEYDDVVGIEDDVLDIEDLVLDIEDLVLDNTEDIGLYHEDGVRDVGRTRSSMSRTNVVLDIY